SAPPPWSNLEPGRPAPPPTQASVPLPGAVLDRRQPSSPLPGPAADAVPVQGNGRAWGKLTIEQGPEQGRFFLLRDSQLTIGRDPALPIALAADASVSRTHARITRTEGGVALEDTGSSHGTRLNGRPISGLVFLRSGDQIQVGTSTLRFEA
ncbi:MAG TPA: FHA domain-containing protein, partial [Herpetosiphonaceae bacterium]